MNAKRTGSSSRNTTKKKHTKRQVKAAGKQDTQKSWRRSMTAAQWKRFNHMQDKDIDISDIPELGADFWKHAKVVVPHHKKAISLRVDEDMLEWFKSQGKGYQSLMNAVLRSYYETHEGDAPRG